MARGFESKDVEFQQSEASRRQPLGPPIGAEERQRIANRRTLELALSNARAQRAAATNPRHQRMLDEAIRTLEEALG